MCRSTTRATSPAWESTRWARHVWDATPRRRCSTRTTRCGTRPTCSSPMARAWYRPRVRIRRSLTWRSPPVLLTSRCKSSIVAISDRGIVKMTDNDNGILLDTPELITRREAVLRVTALLGGVALIGGSALITGCRTENANKPFTPFTPDEIAYLDEIADTILPTTSTPGAKAAKTGAFMALMVHDSYSPRDQGIFRDGMRTIDDATQKAHNTSFTKATPQQRLAVMDKNHPAPNCARH